MTLVDSPGHPAYDELKSVLDELQGNSQAIALQLKALGIKGIRASSLECPIAKYVRSRIAKGFSTATSQRVRTFRADASTVEVRTPDNVAAFIQYFDSGSYDYLVK